MDIGVRRRKVELVCCKFYIALFGLVTSSVDVMIFRLTLMSIEINRQTFKNAYYTRLHL